MALFKVQKISKSYSGIHALEGVSFEVPPGEIHALVGANGAGKSTLLKILCGVIEPDSGILLLDGQEVRLSSPARALHLGIGLVPQEILLCEDLTVMENIFIGHKVFAERSGWINFNNMETRTQELLNELHCTFSPSILVKQLSTAQKQIVQIARSLSYSPRILALDEPTSSLSDIEVGFLFQVLRSLLQADRAILFVSHKLKEIYEIATSATVLRDGHVVGTVSLKKTSPRELVRLMSGKEIKNEQEPVERQPAGIEKLKVRALKARENFEPISFSICAGEIVGFFGLVGSGRTEVAKSIFGIDAYDSGEIYIGGTLFTKVSPRGAIQAGIGFLPEDRKTQGLILDMQIDHNVTLPFLSSLARFGFVKKNEEKSKADSTVRDLSIRCSSVTQKVRELSGGNQQKIALAKWISKQSQILILDEPTKGVDIHSKEEIHRIISETANNGTAVLVISSEIEEIQRLCTRVFIFRNGQIVKELSRHETTTERMMRYATLQNPED